MVPAPIRVSPTAGRSIVVFAPISTSSSIDHAADLRNLVVRAVGPLREAEAVAADDRAVLDDDAIADPHALANRHARVDRRSRRRSARCRPIVDVRVDDGARADRAPRRRPRTDRSDASVAELHAVADAPRGDARPAAGRQRSAKSSTALANARYGCAVAQHRARRRLGQRTEDHRRRARRAKLLAGTWGW